MASAAMDAHAFAPGRHHGGGTTEDAASRDVLRSRMASKEQQLLLCEFCRRRPPTTLSGLRTDRSDYGQLFLLTCLHNCCSECIDQMSVADSVADRNDDARAMSDLPSGNLSASASAAAAAAAIGSSCRRLPNVLCPTCDVQTDAGSLKRNVFAEARLQNLPAIPDGAGLSPQVPCSVCSDGSSKLGDSDASAGASAVATYWCSDCGKYMCSVCRKKHDIFQRQHSVTPAVSAIGSSNGSSNDRRSMATSVTAAVVRCRIHAGAACDFYCADCKVLRCSDCVKACADERHDTGAVDRPRAEMHTSAVADAFRAHLTRLRATAVPRADACADVRQLLAVARRRDEERMRAIKKQAVEATMRASDLAHSELATEYDKLKDRARRMKAGAGDTLALIDTVVQAGDTCTTLRLQKALLSRVAFLEQELDDIACALNSGQVVDDGGDVSGKSPGGGESNGRCVRSMVEQLPVEGSEVGRKFVSVVERWIGSPREHHGFPLVPEENRPAPDEHSWLPRQMDESSPEERQRAVQGETQPPNSGSSDGRRVADGDGARPTPANQPCSADPRDDPAAVAAPPALNFNDTEDCFGLSVDCRDIAMTSDGRVLLAALKHGLKQYAPGGRKLPTWRPGIGADGGAAIVSSVDILTDSGGGGSGHLVERVVVSLIDVQSVAILRRDDDAATTTTFAGSSTKQPAGGDGDLFSRSPTYLYVEERRVDLSTSPFRVSAFGCRFAVAGAHVTDNRESRGYHVVVGRHWSAGPHVELFCVSPSHAAAAGGVGSDWMLELQRTFEHDVQSLAITDGRLLTLSRRQATTFSGSVYVIEAIDFQGNHLWNLDSRYELVDICTSPPPGLGRTAAAPPVLYATVPKRVRVSAYSTDDGRQLADVLNGSGGHTLSAPSRLSLGYRLASDADGATAWLPALAVLIAQDAVAVFVAQPHAAGTAAGSPS